MNIIFNSLKINDFQSIGEAEIEFDNQGIVVVKGINNYEENTSSNGSGKSSIFEGLYFSLYGKTTNGLTNVSNRYTKNNYKLDLKFSIDKINYEIIRDGNKITLLENNIDISRRNKTDTEKYIQENILKISSDIFLNIIYLSQGFKSRISSLTAGGRKDRIEELLGVDELVEEFRLKVQNKKDEYSKNSIEISNNISYNNGTMEQVQNNIDQYQKEINKINEENKKKPLKEELLSKLNDIKSSLEKEESNQKEINQKINKIKNENNEKMLKISEIDKEILNYKSEQNKVINQLSIKQKEIENSKQQEINNIENSSKSSVYEIDKKVIELNSKKKYYSNEITKNIKSIETLKTSDKCPTCGRKFENANEEHIQNEINKFEKINNDYQNEIKNIELNINDEEIKKSKILNNSNLEIKEIKDQISTLKESIQRKLEEINTDINIFESNKNKEKDKIKKTIEPLDTEIGTLHAIESNINSYKANIKLYEERINNLEIESTDKYEKMIKDCNKKLVNIIKDNENLQKQFSELEEKIGVSSHCSSLISKEFKNYLLKSAIEFLNNKLVIYSSLLFSNQEDIIKFIQDGNKLDIYLGDALFESLSGGEKRKVDIAIMLVQKDLSNSMSGTFSNLLILDEIFDGLDSKSIDIVTSILMNVSKDVSSMFVISHKDTVIGYDKQITVVKGKDRISKVI